MLSWPISNEGGWGPRATAKQLEEDLEKADPGVSGVYAAKAITQFKTVDRKEWFKIHWQGHSKSESTLEPVDHPVHVVWGASAMVAEFRASQKTYMVTQLHCDEVTLAVMEVMQRHHLSRSVEFYVQRYKEAIDGVHDKRLQELHGNEYQDVLRSRRSVPLRNSTNEP